METLWAALLTASAFAFVLLALREVVAAVPALSRWLAKLLEPLERAGAEGYVPAPGEFRRLALAGGLAVALLGAIVVGRWPAILAAAVAPFIVAVVFRVRRDRYRRRFEAGLPGFAHAVADAVSAGRSVREALALAAASLDGPTRVEAARLAADLELGRPTAAALAEMRSRLGSPRLDSLCAAVLAGATSGGDLALLLRHLAAAESERLHTARQARSATAQARFTGLVVVALPAGAAVLGQLVAPGLVASVLSNEIAVLMLGVAGVMQIVGFLLIRRLAGKVEVA